MVMVLIYVGSSMACPKGKSVRNILYCVLVMNANVQAVDGLIALACSMISILVILFINNLILLLLDIV